MYTALVHSMRRALGPEKLMLTAHFCTIAWTDSLGGVANRIRPANELDMMLTDGPLADGVMMWWDQLGLAPELAEHRGNFSPTASSDPSRFAFATAFSIAKGTDLPLGWFARYRYAQQIPRGLLTV